MDELAFVPGMELAEGFYAEQVEPLLRQGFPELAYSAALIGPGSEVLGFDTPMSADHHWGPRLLLFLTPHDYQERRDEIRLFLSRSLPLSYRGFPTNYTEPDPEDAGVQQLEPTEQGPVNHRVETLTTEGFFRSYLNLGISEPIGMADWLTLPSHKLRSVVAGKVFRDDLGLEGIRSRLAWYPRDVWLYIMGCAWARIGQEEHLMGRAGWVNDDIGSAIIASRLVRDVMRLAFLVEKEYAPYPKWFGTGFLALRCAPRLKPALEAVVHAGSWHERESGLAAAYETLVEMHNALRITEPFPAEVSSFHGRPFLVIHADKIAEAVFERIEDPALKAASRRQIGSIDLLSDNTDLLEDPSIRHRLRALYEP